jgi:hypothetical protein
MKHVTYAQKSLLFGDEAADLLLEYAATLADSNSADTVQIRAFGVDGDEVLATFLLSDGIDLMAESTHSPLPEPDNAEAIEHMRARMAAAANHTSESKPTASDTADFGSLDDV